MTSRSWTCRVTNLFSGHISGWDNDVAPGYAGVLLLKRKLCLEDYLHIDNAFCVDKAQLLSQFDESGLID